MVITPFFIPVYPRFYSAVYETYPNPESYSKDETIPAYTIFTKALNYGKRGLTNIDLYEVCSIFKEIKEINLKSNYLTNIVLKPLAKQNRLSKLILSKNHLRQIDLSPLKDCNNLKIVDFSYNKLHNINLSPLSSCKKLQTILLDGNKIVEIDLAPLEKSKNIHAIYIDRNTTLKNYYQSKTIKDKIRFVEK